jgi:hypothetical protein
MPRVTFDIHTILPPEQVLAMLTDFSTGWPELWPILARELYEVYEVGATSADVREGSIQPTLMWERDYYSWSPPGRVRWTVKESNYSAAGSCLEASIQKTAAGASQVHVECNRRGAGLKGKVLIALVVLTGGAIIRPKVFHCAFDRAEAARRKLTPIPGGLLESSGHHSTMANPRARKKLRETVKRTVCGTHQSLAFPGNRLSTLALALGT